MKFRNWDKMKRWAMNNFDMSRINTKRPSQSRLVEKKVSEEIKKLNPERWQKIGPTRMVEDPWHTKYHIPPGHQVDYVEKKKIIRKQTFGKNSIYFERSIDRKNSYPGHWRAIKDDIARFWPQIKWKHKLDYNATWKRKMWNFTKKLFQLIDADVTSRFDFLGVLSRTPVSLIGDTIDAVGFGIELGVFGMFIHEEATQLANFLVKDAMCQKDYSRLFLHNELTLRQQVFSCAQFWGHWHIFLWYTNVGYKSFIASSITLHNIARHLYPANTWQIYRELNRRVGNDDPEEDDPMRHINEEWSPVNSINPPQPNKKQGLNEGEKGGTY